MYFEKECPIQVIWSIFALILLNVWGFFCAPFFVFLFWEDFLIWGFYYLFAPPPQLPSYPVTQLPSYPVTASYVSMAMHKHVVEEKW